jgi:hypothetical protein
MSGGKNGCNGSNFFNIRIMKKVIIFVFLISIFTVVTANNMRVMNPPILGIKISFSTKAYWNGTECADRIKGCCLHIEMNMVPPGPGQIVGEISSSADGGLRLIASKKDGILQATFTDLFRKGKFIVNGTGTFSQDLLSKLGLDANFIIPEGEYPYSIEGDKITIIFK